MLKLFCDTADFSSIKELCKNPLIKGWTCNPTLMHKAGITDYEKYAKDLIKYLKEERPDTCLSLEVFAQEPLEMIEQAIKIDSWSDKYPVYIKIPYMHPEGNNDYGYVIHQLSVKHNMKVNVTAVFTSEQVEHCLKILNQKIPSIISIFAGRIFDTGVDAEYIVHSAVHRISESSHFHTELLWASPRQVYDYVLAKNSGCDIITMTPDLIKKLDLFDKDLLQYSVETSKMFYDDGVKAGFKI